jgi:hypothetical protein
MVREPLRNAAGCRDDEDVGVAIVFAGEGDLRAVGREDRVGLDAGAGRQAGGVAAVAVNAPQIAGVGEDNKGAIEGRALEQGMRRLSGEEERGKCGEDDGINLTSQAHWLLLKCGTGNAAPGNSG